MTRDDLWDIPAGDLLNRLIAERVMGWRLYTSVAKYTNTEHHSWYDQHGHTGWSADESSEGYFNPSEDIATAWMLMHKFCKRYWQIGWDDKLHEPGWWVGDARLDVQHHIWAATAPHAICLAALQTTIEPDVSKPSET